MTEVPQAPMSARHAARPGSSNRRGSRERSTSREDAPAGRNSLPAGRLNGSKEPLARGSSKISVESSPAVPGIEDKFVGERWRKARLVLERIQKEEAVQEEKSTKMVLTSEDIDDEFDKLFAADTPLMRQTPAALLLDHEDWQDQAAKQAGEHSYAERVCFVHDHLTASKPLDEEARCSPSASPEASPEVPRLSLQSGSMLAAMRAKVRRSREDKELEMKVQPTKSEKDPSRADTKISEAMKRLRMKIAAARNFSMRTMGSVDAVVTET